MGFAEYEQYDGLGLAELVKDQQVSVIELIEAAIERIEKHNDALNAVVFKAYDEARDQALEGVTEGPFSGVPFLMKDLSRPVKGWCSAGGSHFASDAPADRDCVMVQRYRDAGVILLGSTNTPELGIPGITVSDRLGVCRNPWNTEYHAGGSSGGAAAAVASDMVPVAHGTDGGGSIRTPASSCGLVGLKPTRHRNPVEPDGLWQVRQLVDDHVVCRTVRDCAAMLDATGYEQAGSPYAHPWKDGTYLDEVGTTPKRLKIFWSSETAFQTDVDPEVKDALEKTAVVLSELGHDVREEGLGVDYRAFYREWRTMAAANFAGEIKGLCDRFGREPGEGELGPLAQRMYDAGRNLSAADGFLAFQKLRIESWKILERFESFDVYVTPAMGMLTPKISEYDPYVQTLEDFDQMTRSAFPFTAHFNVTGQPSVSLPLWEAENGLPIGMLFTAKNGREDILFRLAGQLERALPWGDRRPEMFG